MGVLAGTLRTAAGRVLALGGAAVVCGALAVALAARVSTLAAAARGARADGLVELAVLAAGALVLVWLSGSAAVAAVCVAARGLGRQWRRGERCVRRFAPAVIRRAAIVVVAAGIGAASVTSASAAELPPTGSPTATVATADGEGIDLGWVVTGTARGGTAAPSTTAPGTAATLKAQPSSTPAQGPTSGDAAPPTSVASGPSTVRTPAAQQPSAVETPADARGTSPAHTPPPSAAPTPAPTGHASPAPTPAPAQRPSPAGIVGPDALSVPRAPRWTPVPPVADEVDAAVVVARGDTLWDIAARHLPAGATDAEVAAAWPAWYAANTATIGPDPSLIRPGQVLAVPTAVAR